MAAEGKVCPNSPAACGLGSKARQGTGWVCCLTSPCAASRGVQLLPCGGVSPGQQQEKARWCCCAGVGGLIGHLGDGLKARLLSLWKVTHIPRKIYVLSFLHWCSGCCVTLAEEPVWVRVSWSQCSCRWATEWLLSSTPEQCPVS